MAMMHGGRFERVFWTCGLVNFALIQHKIDYNDAEAIAETALRPNLKTVSEKTQEQLDLQALHRVRSRLVPRRTATMNQIRAFLIEQGITVRKSVAALRTSLEAILGNRDDEMSLRMRKLILGLQQDWIWADKRIEMTTSEIEAVSKSEASCQRLMTIPAPASAAASADLAIESGETGTFGFRFGPLSTASEIPAIGAEQKSSIWSRALWRDAIN